MTKQETLFHKIVNNASFRNSIWLIGEKIYQMIVSLVVGVLSARYLGPSDFGVINYSQAIIAFFLPLVSLGIESVLTNEIISNRENEGKIIGSIIGLRFGSSVISMASISLLVLFIDYGNTTLLIVSIFQSIALLFRAFDAIDYWFQSLHKSKYIAIFKGITYTITTLYRVILLITKQDVIWFALSSSIDVFLLMIFSLIFYNMKNGRTQKLNFSFATGISILKRSYHFILSGFLVVIYSQLSKIILGYYIDSASVGIYSVSIILSTLWLFIPQAIIFSVQPIVFSMKKNSQDYMKTIKVLYSIIWWGGIVYSLIMTLFAKQIILILYGADYINATIPLKIYVWSTLFAALGDARTVWIVAENKNKFVKWYLLFGSVVNLILSFVLVPLFGTIGASITILITQIVICILAPMIFSETRIHTRILFESLILKELFS